MSKLPPYSTFRTDKTQPMLPQAVSQGNVLSFTPPNFKHTLNVKFPDSRLAVCEKCKKNYKTRDSCRVRSGHTTPPWTTAFICITLDRSCTDSNGKYIDDPLTIRMVQWQPYCVKKDFDSKTPVCAACKKTNRTRSFCRSRHKHRQLPWCTVFVVLSAVQTTDPATVVAAPSKPIEKSSKSDSDNDQKEKDGSASEIKPASIPEKEGSASDCNEDERIELETEPISADNVNAKETNASGGDSTESDNINDIEESRTFLVKVSYKEISVHWLELNGDGSKVSNSESEIKALNTAIRNPSMAVSPVIDPSYYLQMQQQAALMQQQHLMMQNQQQFAAWQQAQYKQQQMAQFQGQQESQVQPIEGMPTQGTENASNREETAIKTDGSTDGITPAPSNPPSLGGTAPVQTNPAEWQTQMMLQQQMFHQQMMATQQQYLMMTAGTGNNENSRNIDNEQTTEISPSNPEVIENSESKARGDELDADTHAKRPRTE